MTKIHAQNGCAQQADAGACRATTNQEQKRCTERREARVYNREM